MQRSVDVGRRIIKYRNYPRMLLGVLSISIAIAGILGILSGRGALWPLTALGFYWAFITLQDPNMDIYYSSQTLVLWWGPLFPLRKRRRNFSDIKAVLVEKTFSHNMFVSVKQEGWDLSLLLSEEKKLFLMTFPTRELAQEFAAKLAPDLMSKVQIKEDPKRKVSPIPPLINPLQRMKERLGKDKKHF